MSRLATRKTRLRFETDDTVRGRELIVTCMPRYCLIRPKGKRSELYPIAWATIFEHAAQIAANQMREQRKKQRGRR